MKKLICLCCTWLFILFSFSAMAESGEPEITPVEWTWNPGKVATFEGRFILPDNCPDSVVLHLTVKPEPAQNDPGRIVFTFVNQKRLTVKKQTDEYTLKTEGLTGEITFKGSWFIPDETYYSAASVTFTMTGEDGSVITEKTAEFNENEGPGQSGDQKIIRLPFQTSKIILWAGIAAGAIWLAALLRIIIHKIRKQSIKGV